MFKKVITLMWSIPLCAVTIIKQSRSTETQNLYCIKMWLSWLHVSALQETIIRPSVRKHFDQANVSYVLDLIEVFSSGWPDDGLLQGRNM
jgi:hypothetical protein